jgi:hypothetical protein
MPKQLIVKGHYLRHEGRVFRIGERYYLSLRWVERSGPGLCRCSCGWESESLPTTAARQRAHRAHKEAVVAAAGAGKDA